MNLTHTLEADDNDSTYTKIGAEMVYRGNTGFSEQYWYTSVKWGTTLVLNSITFFKKSRSEYWEYAEKETILEIPMADSLDYAVYQLIGDNVIYKANSGTDLRTFLSCPYNYKYFTEKEDEDQKLDNRNCTKCPESREPFSYGFDDDKCLPCRNLVGFIANAPAYVQFFYNLNCEGYELCESTNTCVEETVTETNDVVEEEVIFVDGDGGQVTNVVTEEEEGDSATLWILILIVVVLLVIVVGYFLLKSRRKGVSRKVSVDRTPTAVDPMG